MAEKQYALQDSIEVLGKRWELRQPTRMPQGDMADCDPPWKTGKMIRIQAGLPKNLVLRCLVHEMTHAAFWFLDEEYVKRFAEDVERELIRNGFADC